MITRRKVLKKLIYFGGFILFNPNRLLSDLIKQDESIINHLKLANFFVNKDSACAVGNEYLKIYPEEADPHLLVDLICKKNLQNVSDINRTDSRIIKEILIKKHLKDLENGRTVIVSGWVLSKTEAKLCALAAII